jgi:bifunctional DNA-binding transcriptional regulator/antitoxin component of YhaV-PrlF toxin-antitoxin module
MDFIAKDDYVNDDKTFEVNEGDEFKLNQDSRDGRVELVRMNEKYHKDDDVERERLLVLNESTFEELEENVLEEK